MSHIVRLSIEAAMSVTRRSSLRTRLDPADQQSESWRVGRGLRRCGDCQCDPRSAPPPRDDGQHQGRVVSSARKAEGGTDAVCRSPHPGCGVITGRDFQTIGGREFQTIIDTAAVMVGSPRERVIESSSEIRPNWRKRQRQRLRNSWPKPAYAPVHKRVRWLFHALPELFE
jgi:hypothetical protein